ncbi:hypothetical protein [Humidisolicoccus flavus]|uniref:hypothetical protein n=1 Tax=Humidisolicoccus flavus TaxID=3111414 RepID=UPI003247EF3D
MSSTPSNRLGAARVLIAVYAVLALAATGRSVYQIISKFDEAPVAYSLSAVAAVVYIVATLALALRGRVWRIIAFATILFELVGVIVVGILSFTHPELFQHPSVWSAFGAGYLFIPAVLPIIGLVYLTRATRAKDAHPQVQR